MKKRYILIISLALFLSAVTFGQQNYNNFNGQALRNFGPRNGKLDSTTANPAINSVNANAQTAKYRRAGNAKYDNVKIYPQRKLVDVSPYATHLGIPPKLTLKVYTSAPVGTKVELQLGKKDDDQYPSGVHSQYEAVTSVQNAWEVLTFTFAQIPEGSKVDPTEVDKITLLFSPNSSNTDTYYFDELAGPELVPESAENHPAPKEEK